MAHGELLDDSRTLELSLTFTEAPLPEELQTGYGLGITRYQQGDVEVLGRLGLPPAIKASCSYWARHRHRGERLFQRVRRLGELQSLAAVARLLERHGRAAR